MSRVITIASHKGGVGKTATALNLGVSLARAGHKVLLVDGATQGCLSMSVAMKEKSRVGLLQVLRKTAGRSEVIVRAKKLPLAMTHLGIEKLSDMYALTHGSDKGKLDPLKVLLQSLADNFDYTIIDTSTNIGSLNATLLSCSNSVILPVTCKNNAVKTLPLLLKLIQQIKNKLNSDLTLLGLVVQMLDVKNPYEMETLSILRQSLPRGTFFSTYIPYAKLYEKAEVKTIPACFLPEAEELRNAYENFSREVILRQENVLKGEQNNEPPEELF